LFLILAVEQSEPRMKQVFERSKRPARRLFRSKIRAVRGSERRTHLKLNRYLKSRFQQIDIWMTTYPIEVI